MTWQPIETAPKDGTRMLVRLVSGDDDVRVYGARWDTQRFNKKPNPYWQWDMDVFGVSTMRCVLPTHWQPLPSTDVPST